MIHTDTLMGRRISCLGFGSGAHLGTSFVQDPEPDYDSSFPNTHWTIEAATAHCVFSVHCKKKKKTTTKKNKELLKFERLPNS